MREELLDHARQAVAAKLAYLHRVVDHELRERARRERAAAAAAVARVARARDAPVLEPAARPARDGVVLFLRRRWRQAQERIDPGEVRGVL